MSSRRRYAIDQVLAAVTTTTGQMYLENFATEIGELAGTDYVAITVLADDDHLQTLTVCHKGQLADNFAWPLAGSPAAGIVANTTPCTFRSRAQERFPGDQVLRRTGVQSYIGVPLLATGGHPLGVLILMDREPIIDDLFIINIVQLFADRIVAEIERSQQEPHLHEEVRRLENELHRCRTDLQATRSELEAFSHAVSHDLRGPLRAIDGFSETLAVDHAADLDDTARDYLQRIRTNTDQMKRMVSAFLAVSRVIRHPLRASTVDLSQTGRKLLERLQQRDPEREVTVRVQPDLHAHGDPELLTTALEHLLSNAWAFTRDTANARIELSSERKAGETVYCVSDNGAGFDMAYASHLFELFQRLHRQQVCAGTGVGLAIVKRIIHRHGGKLWAHGEIGAGASFYFTLVEIPGPD